VALFTPSEGVSLKTLDDPAELRSELVCNTQGFGSLGPDFHLLKDRTGETHLETR
jgi:hypothetical protein